jgi:RNA polymerase sigma-70 factor, ECF subfamily
MTEGRSPIVRTDITDAERPRASRRASAPFRIVYERHAAAVYGFVLRRTRDAEVAHDLTAGTFAQAWLSRRRFRDQADGSAGPWLIGIARNLVAQAVRRRVELEAYGKLGVMERLDRASAQAEPEERRETIADLPEGQRAALALRVVHELDYGEIAASLGTTPGAARVRVARGPGELRQRLTGAGEEAR